MLNNFMLKKINASTTIDIVDPIPISTGSEFIGFLLNIIIGIGWTLVFVFLFIGILKFVTSRGEKENTSAAQQIITYAVIGGILLLLFGSFEDILFNIFGENTITKDVKQYLPEVEEEANYPDPYCDRNPNAVGCGSNGGGGLNQ